MNDNFIVVCIVKKQYDTLLFEMIPVPVPIPLNGIQPIRHGTMCVQQLMDVGKCWYCVWLLREKRWLQEVALSV